MEGSRDLAREVVAPGEALVCIGCLLQDREAQRGAAAGELGGLTEPDYSLVCGSYVFPTEVVLATKLVAQILKIQWQAINRICHQDIAGENASLGCIPIDVVLQIAIFALEDLTFCNSDVVSAETRTTFQRTQDLHIDHTTLNSKLDGAKTTLADVNSKLGPFFPPITVKSELDKLGAFDPPNLTVKSEFEKLGGFDPALSFTIESAPGFGAFDPALGVTVKSELDKLGDFDASDGVTVQSVLGDFDPPSGVTVQSVLGDFDPPAGITVQSTLGDFDPPSGVTVQSEIAAVQNTLDTVIEHRRVHLQVIELE